MQEQESSIETGEIYIDLKDDELEIKELVDDFSEAIQARDIDRIMSFYSDDVVAFDLMPPLRYEGKDHYRKAWEMIKDMQGNFVYEFHDLHVAANTDVAFSYSLNRMSGTTKEGYEMECWLRHTGCYRRINGSWMIVHESTSVPIDMKTEKGLFDLKPW